VTEVGEGVFVAGLSVAEVEVVLWVGAVSDELEDVDADVDEVDTVVSDVGLAVETLLEVLLEEFDVTDVA
jgi:hypothetical protein